jgi:hypothetical protein
MSMRKIIFTPEPNITAYELAVIISNVLGVRSETMGPQGVLRNTPIYCDDARWEAMSPGIRRHWTVQP